MALCVWRLVTRILVTSLLVDVTREPLNDRLGPLEPQCYARYAHPDWHGGALEISTLLGA